MLQTKEGDLFTGIRGPGIIVHGCNAQAVMGSGFAGHLRRLYPDAYRAYHNHATAHGLKVGDVIVHREPRKLLIVHAITQEFFGRDKETIYVSYAGVHDALTKVARIAAEQVPPLPVHLPFIGGGLANGDRDQLF
ncbi:macro domain-containing protein [Polaromonas sp. P1(28)-13]|nr:macro domain-containing protein [Polaromonas sp. P1(28)-13]